jgi:hypothetical protein
MLMVFEEGKEKKGIRQTANEVVKVEEKNFFL